MHSDANPFPYSLQSRGPSDQHDHCHKRRDKTYEKRDCCGCPQALACRVHAMEEYCERGDDECDGPQENCDSKGYGRSAAYVDYAEDSEVESREHARKACVYNWLHESIFGF